MDILYGVSKQFFLIKELREVIHLTQEKIRQVARSYTFNPRKIQTSGRVCTQVFRFITFSSANNRVIRFQEPGLGPKIKTFIQFLRILSKTTKFCDQEHDWWNFLFLLLYTGLNIQKHSAFSLQLSALSLQSSAFQIIPDNFTKVSEQQDFFICLHFLKKILLL